MDLGRTKQGRLIKRYKRFLADVSFDDEPPETCHVPNTGSMESCLFPGEKVCVSYSSNPKRKYPLTLELTHNGLSWIGVNTSRTNALVDEALKNHAITLPWTPDTIRREAVCGQSRLDFHLSAQEKEIFIEVKNVTLKKDSSAALFPDSVSLRGQKHLEELMQLRRQGKEAAMFFVVQREDVTFFSPARDIDPEYARKLEKAQELGVTIRAFGCKLSPRKIYISHEMPTEI